MTLYTIGSSNKSAREFFVLLKKHKIDKVLDIRLKNQSQLLGFTKGRDLAFFLMDLLGIAYEHVPQLAPSPDLLQNYLDKKRIDTYKRWDIYQVEFNKLLNSRNSLSIFRNAAGNYQNIALLCSEPKPDKCHRRLVAEFLQRQDNSISIVHI